MCPCKACPTKSGKGKVGQQGRHRHGKGKGQGMSKGRCPKAGRARQGKAELRWQWGVYKARVLGTEARQGKAGKNPKVRPREGGKGGGQGGQGRAKAGKAGQAKARTPGHGARQGAK